MKKIAFILVMSSLIANAQTVLNTARIAVPFIGRGGTDVLNWAFDNDTIYIYANSYIKGIWIAMREEDMEKNKKKYKGKNYFEKLLSSSISDSYYTEGIMPVIYELKVDADNLRMLSEKKDLVHYQEDLPGDMNVYFKIESGIFDLSLPFKSGKIIKYHYKDMNIPFPYASKYGRIVAAYPSIKMKGEGLLGVKNIKAILVFKKISFDFKAHYGFGFSTEEQEIIDFSKDERLKGFGFVANSDKIINGSYFLWFMKKKDFSKYKMVVYNIKNQALTVNSFDFKVPRKHKVINKAVYDKELKLKGVLNVFGYHRKGKRNKDSYPTNRFDFIYTDVSGNIKFETKLDYGTKKKYKNVITPILIFEKNEDQLDMINAHVLSIFKGRCERVIFNKNGESTVISPDNYFIKKEDPRIRCYSCLLNHDRIDKFGDYYIVRKIVSRQVRVPGRNPEDQVFMGMDIGGAKKTIDEGINYTILDKDFSPLRFYSFSTNPRIADTLSFQTIEKNDKEIVLLAAKPNHYYLIKIDDTPKISFFPLKIVYAKIASPLLYATDHTMDFALVNKKDRLLYILSQFYDYRTYDAGEIKEIGITKVTY